MTIYETTDSLLNPLDFEKQQQVLQGISGAKYLPSFTLVKKSADQYVLAYPVVQFEKPSRVSKKTGAVKQASACYAVCANEPLGEGSFGFVYPVLGVWKLKEGGWVFKAGTPHDRKVLKTNVNLTTNEILPSSKILASYAAEYQAGQYVPYMGYTIKPFSYEVPNSKNQAAFLFMKRQEGVSLKSLIEKNELTSNQRLTICVNLIKALQALHAPQANGHYLVHCDIKPENIIVDDAFNVRFIDFGLSGLNVQFEKGTINGTPLYMDPYLYSANIKVKQDKSHDEASLARVFAEVWRDDSRQLTKSKDELDYANQNNVITNLLEGINDLTGIEQQIIQQNITQLTEYEPQDRNSMANALQVFNDLLTYRTQNATQQLAQLAAAPLAQLTNDQVLELLRSPFAAVVIQRFIQQPNEYPKLQALGAAIFTLDRSLLQQLQQHNYDFSSFILSSTCLRNAKLSAEQTQCALELGVQLSANTLNQWLNQPLSAPDLEWAKLFRVLYKATPNANASVVISPEHALAVVFFHYFGKHPETAKDDALNLQLSHQHIKVFTELAKLDDVIADLLDRLGADSPLALAIEKIVVVPSTLLTIVPIKLHALLAKIERLLSISQEILDLQTGSSVELLRAKRKLTTNLGHRAKLKDMDLNTALDVDSLVIELDQVIAVNRLIQKLERLYPPAEYILLHQQLDALYASAPSELPALKTQASHLCTAAQALNKIAVLKLRLANLGCELQVDHAIVKEFTNLLANEIQFTQAQTSLTLVNNAYSVFHQLTQLFEQLTTLINRPMPVYRKNLMQKLQAATYTELNELTSEMLVQLFTQSDAFFALEKQFAQMLSGHPRVSEFLYTLLAHNLPSLSTQSYADYSLVFERINEHTFFDESLLNCINQYIKLTGSYNTKRLVPIHAEFKETLWKYLSVGFNDPQQHRQQCTQAIEALIRRANEEIGLSQARNPNNMFEPDTEHRLKRQRLPGSPVLTARVNEQNTI